ncbi:MAG: quinone-dependent dihydroorotate dehydrogenase [Trueperaceae bacterium]
MYSLIRPLLFASDPEFVHHATIGLLERVGRNRTTRNALSALFELRDPRLAVEAFGLSFPNPVGLAAGMDKDGRALPAWQSLGFGFTEVGSVTATAQEGNPPPRLFRIPADEAIINRMGFNNQGAEALAERVQALRDEQVLRTPLLVNVGKSRSAPLAAAAADYRRCLGLIWPVADGAVINVSSPNTPGLRSLQEPSALAALLEVCDELQTGREMPVLLKLAPDLEDGQLEKIVELAGSHRVAGLVAVNTTIARTGLSRDSDEAGGLSGRPLAPRALSVLRFLASRTDLPIVSVGGIFDATDAIARLRAGASLVELYTGFVYGGPGTVRAILRGLLRHLDLAGVPNVQALIGIDRFRSAGH